VAAFQQREADQGRPVAIVVTSRTSVCDRASTPAGSIALRLEPFDDGRVAAWLSTWNTINAGHTAQPLDQAAVMRYRDLAAQPLLLLMLALYDAEGGRLRASGDLRHDQLYERLLERFARREVDKLGAGLPPDEHADRVEAGLRTLSVVAFAMFNRGAQWVTEADLDRDLQALPGLVAPAPAPAGTTGLRAPLRAAELAIGSFFFVHRARASRDGARLETFEFLHATIGEFLVARLVDGVLRSMIAQERAMTFPAAPVAGDDLLHALLSFAPLAGRRQTLLFVQGMLAEPGTDRAAWSRLLVRLFREAPQPRPPRRYGDYAPQALPIPARIAAYTANLLLLALCARPLTAADLSGLPETLDPTGEVTVTAWHETCLLWHSQGSASGWVGLLDLIAVDRIRRDRRADVALSFATDATSDTPPVDLDWVFGFTDAEPGTTRAVGTYLSAGRREAHFTCDSTNDLQQHVLDPLRRAGLEERASIVFHLSGGRGVTALHGLLLLAGAPGLPADLRAELYPAVLPAIAAAQPNWADVLMHCLQNDTGVAPEVLKETVAALGPFEDDPRIRAGVVRALMAHLPLAHQRGASSWPLRKMDHLLQNSVAWSEVEVDAAIRLAELGLLRCEIDESRAGELLARFAAARPDFTSRIRILVRRPRDRR
jgi:hypothetical protein